ncbi:S-adenosyl-L-methionine-dependent methyltransferase [Xylariaceae sp. FL0255]|nr:S-adenosyl-L-methionine-dependent methyltransferase [Xylariaceae sp. FL0255]
MAINDKDTKELAGGYATASNTQQEAGAFLIERLGISQGMRVLDVGCGPGNITAQIADLVGESGSVAGIDPSKERIAIALEINKPNLTFQQGVAEDLSSFPTGTFDAVYVNSTLHWVQDQPGAMKEFGRVLKSGGGLGISGGSGDFVAIHEKIKANVLSRDPYRSYPEQDPPKFLKRAELQKLLDESGFHKADIITRTIIKKADSAEAMINWLDTSSSGKTYGGIPMELRPKARQEMIVEWNQYVTEQGISMELEVLVTVATKV